MTDSFRRRIRRAGHSGRDSGLTLVEILISMVLSLILAGVLVAAIVTSLNVAGATSDSIKTTVDVQLVSSYLARDAQGAAGTDPNTLQRPEGTGASVAAGDWGGCNQPGTLIARFSWIDRLDIRTEREITSTWALNGAELSRLYCVDGEKKAAIVLGRTLVSAAAQCSPAPDCTGSPTTISLTITGRSEKSTYTTTLSASLRARGQDTPTSASASTVSFLALGNGAATSPCTTVALATAKAYVVGDAVIDDECGDSAVTPTVANIEHPAFGSPAVAGLTSLTGNLQDPLALTPAPTGNCTGSNPAIGTPGNHPNKLTINADSGPVELLSGVYYLCNGLEIGAGASVVSGAGGVTFFLKGGTVTISPSAAVELTAIGTGDQKNILFWVSSPGQTLSIGTGDHVTRLGGTIYAPTSDVVFNGSTNAAAVNVGVLIARTVTINSVPVARFGPIPSLSISPSTLEPATIGLAYSAPLTVTGSGVSQLVNPRWSATGLEPFELDELTGEITGTAACALSLTPRVRVVDETGLAVSADYSLLVLSDLALSDPGNYVRGTKTLTATLTDTCGGTGTGVKIQYSLEGGDTDANGDPIWSTMCTISEAPFDCPWVTTDTGKYVNGASYSLRAIATLSNGTAAESEVIEGVTIDNSKPDVTLNDPGASPLRGTITLVADVFDNETAIRRVDFGVDIVRAGTPMRYDLCSVTQPRDPANQTMYVCEWDTTQPPFTPDFLGTEEYTITAVASDLAGNSDSSSLTRTVNNNSSSISLSDPGSYVRATVSLSVNAYVPSPATVTLVRIQVRPQGGSWADLCTDNSAPWGCQWDTLSPKLVDNATYELRAFMTDSRNLPELMSATVSTIVDNALVYGTDVQATNGTKFHCTVKVNNVCTTWGKIENLSLGKVDAVKATDTGHKARTSDQIVFKFNKAISPSTVLSGLATGTSKTVWLRLRDKSVRGNYISTFDTLDICSSWSSGASCAEVTNIGWVKFALSVVDGGKTAIFPALMSHTLVDGKSVITVSVTGAKLYNDAKGANTQVMVWTPNDAVRDGAGNGCSTRPAAETGNKDKDF